MSMTADEIECIEEGGIEPTISLLRRLAAALDADVHLTAGHDLGSVRFGAELLIGAWGAWPSFGSSPRNIVPHGSRLPVERLHRPCRVPVTSGL